MFWLLVLSTVFLGIGVIVFVLTRDSFRASRSRRETPLIASPVKKIRDATDLNTMMQKKLPPAPPPSHPAALFSGQNGKETDALADTLAHVTNNINLPSGPKAYLRYEEYDDSLDHLLIRHAGGAGANRVPAKEFSIGITEKQEPSLEHEERNVS